MTYFKVDDKLHDHRKSRRARKAEDGRRSADAIGLWVLAGSWCMSNGTDGFVPADELDRWDDNGEQLAQRLVDAELWHHAEQDGEAGYLFHEWDEWQHSVDYLNERRRRNRDRMRTKRANEGASTDDSGADAVRAHSADSADTVGSTSTTTTTTTKNTPRERGTAAAGASADFDRFWSLYPRKVGKAAASKAFTKALRSTDVATIAAGLHNACRVWTATGTEARFIPHPSTWLNEGRWADEQPELPATHTDPAAAIQATYDLPPLPEAPEHIRDAGGKAYTQWMRDTRAEQRAELARQAGVR